MRPIAKTDPVQLPLTIQKLSIAMLVIPAVVLLVSANFMPAIRISLALTLSATILSILAAYLWWQRTRLARRARVLTGSIPSLIEHEISPAFLADLDGNVMFANDAANERFVATEENTIAERLSTQLANPDAVLYRLQSSAEASNAAKEDVSTRNGQFRISVTRIGAQAFLWRFVEIFFAEAAVSKGSDAISLPMLTAGQSGAILYLNEAFRRLLGRRPLALHDVFGVDGINTGDVCRIKTENGPVDCIVAEFRSSAGRREIYAIQTHQDNAGPRLLSSDWDAIEDLPVPLLKISRTGEVVASNREARALLGLQSTAGKQISEMLDGLGRPMIDWVREAFDGHGGNVSQFLRGRGDLQETFVQVTLNIAGKEGERHLVAVLNDVTELKSLELQFVQSQKMQAIGQVAGGVAHDFNNLLTAISGHCDLLLLHHDQGDQDYGDLIQIHQNANRAASLVGQLLAFSRKQNLQPEILDMRESLSDLTHLLNRLVGEKVTLTVRHEPALKSIKADKRQLEQVLMNLVVNARDAMPDGGPIRVVTENLVLTEPMERDRAFVPPGEYVVVRVIDEGHGIPDEKLHKIFEPFFTTKRPSEGTGLGLSTAYGIVKQTGGYIFAESEVGLGTQFALFFPSFELPEIAQMKEEPKASTPMIGSVGGVVLLVEDEAPVRAFASRALRLRGFTVLEADCGEAALAMLDDLDLMVDIFVTDVIMPGMDGPTWVREALLLRPETKVVFVSGYAEDAFADEKSRVPNSVFLPKPFSLSDLTATVQTQLT